MIVTLCYQRINYLWTHYLAETTTLWIIDKLINNHGGLYNRVTAQIHLHPFTLGQTEEYLRQRNINGTVCKLRSFTCSSAEFLII